MLRVGASLTLSQVSLAIAEMNDRFRLQLKFGTQTHRTHLVSMPLR